MVWNDKMMNPRFLNFVLDPSKKANEPALDKGLTVGAVVSATYVILSWFTSNEQLIGIVMGIVAIFAPTITAWLVRRKVWSPATVDALLKDILAHTDSYRTNIEYRNLDIEKLNKKP